MNSDLEARLFAPHGLYVQEPFFAGARIATLSYIDLYVYKEGNEKKLAIILGQLYKPELYNTQHTEILLRALGVAASAAKECKQKGHFQTITVSTLLQNPFSLGGRRIKRYVSKELLNTPDAEQYAGITTGFENTDLSAAVILRQDNRYLHTMASVYMSILEKATKLSKGKFSLNYEVDREQLVKTIADLLKRTEFDKDFFFKNAEKISPLYGFNEFFYLQGINYLKDFNELGN